MKTFRAPCLIATLATGIGSLVVLDAGFVAAEGIHKLTGAQIRTGFAGKQLTDEVHYRIGIFLPSFLLVLIAAPLLARHRGNPNVQDFVKGAYAAAIGTILGACILLGRIAVGGWLTALIGAVSLAVLFRWKVSNPALIAATAVVGLIAYPLLQPAWVMVK